LQLCDPRTRPTTTARRPPEWAIALHSFPLPGTCRSSSSSVCRWPASTMNDLNFSKCRGVSKTERVFKPVEPHGRMKALTVMAGSTGFFAEAAPLYIRALKAQGGGCIIFSNRQGGRSTVLRRQHLVRLQGGCRSFLYGAPVALAQAFTRCRSCRRGAAPSAREALRSQKATRKMGRSSFKKIWTGCFSAHS
jgi:hypothetical protein